MLDSVWAAVVEANALDLSEDLILVPSISNANHFGLLSVFTKPKTVLIKLFA